MFLTHGHCIVQHIRFLAHLSLAVTYPAVDGADIVESLDLRILVPYDLLLKVRLLNLLCIKKEKYKGDLKFQY